MRPKGYKDKGSGGTDHNERMVLANKYPRMVAARSRLNYTLVLHEIFVLVLLLSFVLPDISPAFDQAFLGLITAASLVAVLGFFAAKQTRDGFALPGYLFASFTLLLAHIGFMIAATLDVLVFLGIGALLSVGGFWQAYILYSLGQGAARR